MVSAVGKTLRRVLLSLPVLAAGLAPVYAAPILGQNQQSQILGQGQDDQITATPGPALMPSSHG